MAGLRLVWAAGDLCSRGVQHEAWTTRNWEREGIAWIIVTRVREPGVVAIGAFLVDTWCLGVKDAYAEELTPAELEELLDTQLAAGQREAITPACAKKLIEGALHFAQKLGFLPHRDFRKARKVLNGIDAAGCPRDFEFGHAGRVHFVAGPQDDDARVRRVLAVLEAKLGADSFDFTPYAAAEGADWDALDMMFRFFESPHCPDPKLSGFFVAGYVSGAVILDPDGDPLEWWKDLFGGTEPALPENEEFSPVEIVRGFVEEWIESETQFNDGNFEPPLPELEDEDYFSALADHCRGFLRACDRQRATVDSLATTPGVADALDVFRRYSELSNEGPTAVGRRSLSPQLAEAFRTLWSATAELRSA